MPIIANGHLQRHTPEQRVFRTIPHRRNGLLYTQIVCPRTVNMVLMAVTIVVGFMWMQPDAIKRNVRKECRGEGKDREKRAETRMIEREERN